MSSSQVGAPNLSVSALAVPVRSRVSSARLMPAADAFTFFGPELARLARQVAPATAMTSTPAWWQALPAPRGYSHRLLVLHRGAEVCAAVCFREQMLLGLPTGFLQGSDAKGEALVLCAAGDETAWLVAGIQAVFDSRRCVALLLNRPGGDQAGEPGAQLCSHRGAQLGGHFDELSAQLEQAGLQQRALSAPAFWRTRLHRSFDDTLAPFGRRTRRNLRHALRRVRQNGWQFLPELTVTQVSEATTALATRSTHPYSPRAIAARLELESTNRSSFSMGLRSAGGEWLSMISGVRRAGGLTDIFWQANVASRHDSLATAMRALLMRYEGERGTASLRFIGGTSPLLEHCCQPDPAQNLLITRPGLRLTLLRQALKTRLVSPANPMRKLLELQPGQPSCDRSYEEVREG